MNIQTLDVSKQQAMEAVKHYRQAIKQATRLEQHKEDVAILRGYNQVLKGRELIELSKVIAAGGADEKHRPRLAVMRADRNVCFVQADRSGRVTFCDIDTFYGRRARDLRIVLPDGTLPSWSGDLWSTARGHSVVPLIPPQHRPVDALSNYHILWEATWQNVPVDPALIKHLGGDLWVVLAVWDLTELERAVLGGRAAGR